MSDISPEYGKQEIVELHAVLSDGTRLVARGGMFRWRKNISTEVRRADRRQWTEYEVWWKGPSEPVREG